MSELISGGVARDIGYCSQHAGVFTSERCRALHAVIPMQSMTGYLVVSCRYLLGAAKRGSSELLGYYALRSDESSLADLQ